MEKMFSISQSSEGGTAFLSGSPSKGVVSMTSVLVPVKETLCPSIKVREARTWCISVLKLNKDMTAVRECVTIQTKQMCFQCLSVR